MKNRMFKLMLVALIITAGTVMAANTNTNGPYTDTQIADKVAHEVRMYSRYTIWDNISVRVHEGDVELTGQVSQPFKKADLGRVAQSVPGVRSNPLKKFFGRSERIVPHAAPRRGRWSTAAKSSRSVADYERTKAALTSAG